MRATRASLSGSCALCAASQVARQGLDPREANNGRASLCWTSFRRARLGALGDARKHSARQPRADPTCQRFHVLINNVSKRRNGAAEERT
jgi:hypothetical protein